MYAQYATIHETKRNGPLCFSLSLPLYHSLAIFTGEGGSPGGSLPVVAVAISLFSICLPRFIYLPYLYHTVLYPLPFPPSLPPSLHHLSQWKNIIPTTGTQTNARFHPSIHTSILFNSLPPSLARLRRRRGDHMVFFSFFYIYIFIYLFIYPLSLSCL
ncbi:hypothetical protein B9Z19DRAFT_43363 [Tuber borchii]|uniref:Uncharacterized protein n=1 Tax=Tuber borchii TaxID=42251 RepID=A0A2T6ZTD9_TUBBO|nr:hypothetical protein B9Z19DRAFT_43363 [Tuber borchii]